MIVVTGGAKGIGKALVKKYLSLGKQVLAIDIDVESLKELKEECGKGDELLTLNCDVSKSAAWESHRQWFLSQPRVTLWFNNAGLIRLGDFESIAPPEFDRVIEVNFWGVVHGTRFALSLMKEPLSGAIVNVSSLNGVIAAPFMSAYVASKHAVTGFTRSLQLEHEQSQNPIRIILVSPGFVKTDILNSNKEFKLPDWMSMVTEPTEKVAQEIVRGIERGESEIVATLHGKVINQILRVLPRTLPRATKLLVAKNWKQLLGLEPIKKE